MMGARHGLYLRKDLFALAYNRVNRLYNGGTFVMTCYTWHAVDATHDALFALLYH